MNGYKLISLGGSWYFLLSGVGLVLSGVQLARGRRSGAGIVAMVPVGTTGWAIADVGLDFWPLVSRLLTFVGVGILVALAYPLLRTADGGSSRRGPSSAAAGALAFAFIATVAGMFSAQPTVRSAADGTKLAPVDAATEQRDWAHYGNMPGGTRFVALDQVTRANVSQL